MSRELIPEIRYICNTQTPYWRRWLSALIPVETPNLRAQGAPGPVCVDRYGRMYYELAWLMEQDLLESAGVMFHESLHLSNKHFKLSEEMGLTKHQDLLKLNYAADASINQICWNSGYKLPKGVVDYRDHRWPPNLAPLEYWRLIEDELDKSSGKKKQQGDGKPGEDGEPQPGGGGSCADGKQRPWEAGPPDETDPSVPPGLTEFEQELINRHAAQEAEAYEARHPGKVPMGIRRWAKELLRPTVDPRRELLALVRHATNHTAGMVDWTYQRQNRRQLTGGVILPALVAPTPRITICGDTSGSMQERDTSLGLGLIGKVIKSLPDQRGVRVLVGDTCVHAAKRVFDPRMVELFGGGGTDMGNLIEHAANERPAPQLIIVYTDGETPWPSEPVPMPVVACISREMHGYYEPPEWIKAVRLTEASD